MKVSKISALDNESATKVILFNGERISLCQEADEEEGYIKRYKLSGEESGVIRTEDGKEPLLFTEYGKVKIIDLKDIMVDGNCTKEEAEEYIRSKSRGSEWN